MGEEIEIYILKKLDDAIRESKASSEFHFAARLLLPNLHKDFTELKDLIQKKRDKIKQAAAAASPSNAPATHPKPAVRDPAANVKTIPDASKPSAPATDPHSSIPGAPSDAGDEKEIGTCKNAGDAKETGETDAPSDDDAGDEKESGDAGDEKEIGTSKNAGDAKETGELDAPSDDDDGDKKETGAPGDEKEAGAPLADSAAEKELDATTSATTTTPHDSKASTPAMPRVTSGDKKESIVGKATSEDASEISPATDAVTGDKSITPPASVGDGEKESDATKTATSAKTSSAVQSEISPVTDSGVADHKSKTPPPTSAGAGKKESGIPPADKSTTAVASTKTEPNAVVTKPVNEEDFLREQLYYINNLLTEWQMITKKPSSYSLSSIREFSKTLKKIKQDLKPETTKKTDESSHSGTPPTASSDNSSLIRTTPEVVEFRWSTRVNLKKVYGFEDKILSLERLLVLRRKDTDTFKAFGIHGMAGVGKTTLCQSIFNRPKVTEYFFPRIWVCLSKQRGEDEDPKTEVVKRMLRCLGFDDEIINKVDEKQSIRGLLFALRLQLTGKRYFIVLDDAHNPDEWFKMPDSDAENDNNKIYEKFSYGLPKECGGTVIVTSRVEQVVKNMVGDEENLRCIEPLTDQETCWSIFTDTVKEDGIPFPPELEKLKLEIVKRCDGLPLAAKLLGQIKHKELRENPTAAIIHRAAVEAGNQQAAVQAAK